MLYFNKHLNILNVKPYKSDKTDKATNSFFTKDDIGCIVNEVYDNGLFFKYKLEQTENIIDKSSSIKVYPDCLDEDTYYYIDFKKLFS